MKKNKFIDKFMNGVITPSSIKFEWRVHRFKNVDINAIFNGLKALHLYEDFEEIIESDDPNIDKTLKAKRVNNAFDCLKEKYTSKRWTYCLIWRSPQIDAIVKAVAEAKNKKETNAIMKSKNYKTIKDKNTAELSKHKDKHFSSLSNMQKYVDKNHLGIDVYKLKKTW